MKKVTSILLAMMMVFLMAFTAMADEVPAPEGGKKFESNWAIEGGLVEIYYEEQGYRVAIDIEKLGEGTGSIWEYSCYYHEDTDSLLSVSSLRTDYTVNPDNGDKTYKDNTYEGLDEENTATEFTIDAEGKLIWKDGREDAGAGLKFTDIGQFEGVWKNEAEETEVEFMWDGIDKFQYTVYIKRGKEGADNYTLFLMDGDYDPATGRLSAFGTCTLYTKNASGEYESSEDGETYDAFFSKTEDGKLLYETANGIELEYDLMGHSQG
jgi:hypothetical protein